MRGPSLGPEPCYNHCMKTITLNNGLDCLVDDRDHEALAQFRWCARKARGGRFYAARAVKGVTGSQRILYMHRELCPVGKGMVVDHINRNPLDNRRENLRPATYSINSLNADWVDKVKSAPRGGNVHYLRRDKRWRATIHVGTFGSKEEAAAGLEAMLAKINT